MGSGLGAGCEEEEPKEEDIYITPTHHRLKARVTRIALQCSQQNMDMEMCSNNFIFTKQFHDILSLSLSLSPSSLSEMLVPHIHSELKNRRLVKSVVYTVHQWA